MTLWRHELTQGGAATLSNGAGVGWRREGVARRSQPTPARLSFLIGRRPVSGFAIDAISWNEGNGVSGQEDEPVGRPLVRLFEMGRMS